MSITQTVLSTIGSTAVISLLSRIGTRGTYELEDSLFTGFKLYLLNHFSTQQTISIDEYEELSPNELFSASKLYLGTKIDPNCNQLKAYKSHKEKDITLSMGIKEETIDSYKGVDFKWAWLSKRSDMREYHDPNTDRTHYRSEVQTFELTFHKKYKNIAVDSYLPFILKQAGALKESKKIVKMFTTNGGKHSFSYSSKIWTSIPLNHPAKFETLAMEPDMKEMIINDLDLFKQRGEMYKKVGKTHKRGYLLYGPPGTGKSSLVAAMANHLGYDIYDLELTDLRSNSDLRRLLVSTTNRSILLVEDIDCSVEFHDRATSHIAPAPSRPQPRGGYNDEENKVTLSGFLNFIDGLWSSCGDERIIVFTTNHKDTIDPALLRPGRMDVHIHMSYCTPSGFKLLANNYHGIQDHIHFNEIENLIEAIQVTPAEVAEQLLKNESADIAMEVLLKFLHEKKENNEQAEVEDDWYESSDQADEQYEENDEGKMKWMFVKALSNMCSQWRCFGICFLFFVTWIVIFTATRRNVFFFFFFFLFLNWVFFIY